MAELITGAGSAPAPAVGDAPTPEVPEVPEVAQEAPAAPAEQPNTKLAELIREQREARRAREQEAARAKDYESKYQAAQAEIERLRRDNDFESDPVAYAKARGWDKEKQALMGQMLLYDLVPDKAPPDLRQRLFESKQARKEREAQEAAEREAQEAQQTAVQQQYASYVAAVDQAVSSMSPGSFPETEDWFGEDHDTRVRSMIATAINVANAAQREGKVADLSPGAIAAVLEAEVARKMKARDERVQRRAKPAMPAEQKPAIGGGTQPTESTRGTYGSGAPAPKAETDEERMKRAIAAAFGPPR